MADFSKFRSALNGFNRSDVVSYIESVSAEQKAALQALQDENQKLKNEKLKLESKIMQMQQDDEALQEQVNSLAAEAAELTEKLTQAEADKDAAEAAYLEHVSNTEEPAEPEAEDAQDEEEDACSEELAAYRRAEAAERSAVQRANRIYAQISEICESARNKYLESGDEIAALTADLTSGLARLQEAFAEVQVIFDEAADGFDGLELPEISD